LIAGNVEVIGWDRDEVEVTGTVGPDVKEVVVESDGGDVSIEVEIVDDDEKRSKDIDADLTIHVPRESSLEVESVSANISVDETSGTIELESVSGKIEVRGSVREADVASVSGQISLASNGALEEGDFETVSGNIEVRASFDSGGDFSFESVSGNISLYLPSGTAADFDVETFSGKIVNDLGPEAKRESEYAPGKTLRFSTGSGGAQIEIESFSGRIEIRED
jgi:DUF4097 and DUF4098 domain-containing protein YvlB